jgi:hypothetical protein
MKMKKQLVAISSVLFCAGQALAITTDTTPTAEELVSALLGPGITASNVQLKCASNAFGAFADGATSLGFPEGIILSTGKIENVIGPNNNGAITWENFGPGDTDLSAIVGLETNDACVLEFDFSVDVKGTMSFNYIFASDEYREYVGYCTPVGGCINDVFAFFVDGKNTALIPGTDVPVSTNTVNHEDYAQFFRDNDKCQDDENCPIDTQMDGLTTVLSTVPVEVAPGETHHVKLAIADTGTLDYIVDSNVFIQRGSVLITPSPCEGTTVNITGVITTRNGQVNNDQAQFKLKDVPGIKNASYEAILKDLPLVFQFGRCGETPLYSITVPSKDLNVTYLNMRYIVGNLDVVRCVFNSEDCVVNIKATDLDDTLLDTLLTGEMTVSLKVGNNNYTNTDTWTQYDSASSGYGSWRKYRKDI